MQIISSYGVELRKQNIPIRQTLEIYRSAVSYLIGIYVQVWEKLAEIPDAKRRFNAAEHLVHDITVEDRHGMVFIYKPWFPALSVCLFPQIQPCFIRGYCSQRMLDGRSAQIGRHLWEPDIKIKTGMVFLRSMYQMFCSIKTPLCIRDFC